MTRDRIVDAVCWALPVVLWAWGWRAWEAIPKPEGWRGVPVHYDMQGNADRWSTSPFETVWLMPLVVLGVVALVTFLPRIAALPENVRASEPALRWLKLFMALWLGWVHLQMVGGLGGPPRDTMAMPGVWLGLLFLVVGPILPGLKRNAWAGIRVPWTLMHDEVWDVSHKAAGPVWAGTGVAMIALELSGVGFAVSYWLMMAAVLWSAFVVPFTTFKRLQREGRLAA